MIVKYVENELNNDVNLVGDFPDDLLMYNPTIDSFFYYQAYDQDGNVIDENKEYCAFPAWYLGPDDVGYFWIYTELILDSNGNVIDYGLADLNMNPYLRDNRIQISFQGYSRNSNDNSVDISIDIKANPEAFDLLDWSELDDIPIEGWGESDLEAKKIDYSVNEKIYVYINGDLYESFDYNSEIQGTENFVINIPYFEAENFRVDIVSEDMSGNDLPTNVYTLETDLNQNNRIEISLDEEARYYNIVYEDLTRNKSEPVLREEFVFEREFQSSYLFPTTTNEILNFRYHDYYKNIDPIYDETITANISLFGLA